MTDPKRSAAAKKGWKVRRANEPTRKALGKLIRWSYDPDNRPKPTKEEFQLIFAKRRIH